MCQKYFIGAKLLWMKTAFNLHWIPLEILQSSEASCPINSGYPMANDLALSDCSLIMLLQRCGVSVFPPSTDSLLPPNP